MGTLAGIFSEMKAPAALAMEKACLLDGLLALGFKQNSSVRIGGYCTKGLKHIIQV